MCPLIEESEVLQLQTAIDTHVYLAEALPELTVGLGARAHESRGKAAMMAAFQGHEVQLLVATGDRSWRGRTNASLMVIEHAERMGLSQLHQLRGRVGRGAAESSCILLFTTPLSDTAKARLKIIYENTDGFGNRAPGFVITRPGEFPRHPSVGRADAAFCRSGARQPSAGQSAVKSPTSCWPMISPPPNAICSWMAGRNNC